MEKPKLKILNKGYTDVDVVGFDRLITVPSPADSNFAVVEESVGKVIYTDLTAPTDRPSLITRASRPRANVYAGTSIDPTVFAPTKKGQDIMVEVREVWSVGDPDDTSYRVDLPVRAAISLTLPNHELVTGDQTYSLVKRALAMMLKEASTEIVDTTDIDSLLRGVLKR